MPSPMFRVAITDFLSESEFETPVLDGLARVDTLGAVAEHDLLDRVGHYEVLIVYHDVPRLGAAAISRADRCLGIVRAGVGFNNVDIRAAAERGIVVCNIPDYGTEDVADHAMMLLISVARGLIDCHESMRAGVWDYRKTAGAPRLRGKTLAVIGCGNIGTAMALRARAFGIDVVFYDPYLKPGADKALGLRRADSLEAALRVADFVSLHCFLDAGSLALINESALRSMKRGAILINTSRGPVVDQAALLDALDAGHLAGAGLDVFEREPLDDERLRRHPRVVLTPHCAFYTVEGFEEMRRKSAEEARRLLLGHPPRCPVNLDLINHDKRRQAV
jgi:phosphoglycerate dehydrogenase-like enzyme